MLYRKSLIVAVAVIAVNLAFAGVVFDADSAASHAEARKILVSLVDEGRCKVVGVEGKEEGKRKSEKVGESEKVEAYRQALAKQPNRSVVICTVDSPERMRQLLESKPDAVSKLDGRKLVAQKVRCWYVVEGKEEGKRKSEKVDEVIALWPTPIVFVDAACGLGALDQAAVFAAGRCDGFISFNKRCPFFNVERGNYRVNAAGAAEWQAEAKSRNLRLKEAVGRDRGNYPAWTIRNLLDELIRRTPKSERQDEAIKAFRRSQLERTPTGVTMKRDGKTLWNFEINTPEGHPHFHPLCLPSGKTLTDCRPKDHIWHFGYWFAWKHINGYNYWETDLAATKDKPAPPVGEIRVTKQTVKTENLDCIVDLELAYAPRGTNLPVLVESRQVVIDPPDPNGGYIITVRHHFTAMRDCTFDRTAPHGSTDLGKWGGGYAGPTLRVDPARAAEFSVRGFGGGDSPAAVTGRETTFVELSDPKTGEGFRFTQLKAPPTGKFYIWPDRRFVHAGAIYDGPLILRKGETLDLAYKLSVHADNRVQGTLAQRPVERMDRGLVATVGERGTYLSWRLLDTDAPDRGFEVWRKEKGKRKSEKVDGVEKVEKLTSEPIVQTTDFVIPGCFDTNVCYSVDGEHFVGVDGKEEGKRKSEKVEGCGNAPCRRIALKNPNETPGLVGVGDLDGDGRYDFVVKTPSGGTDPWDLVYKPATNTCRLEAYSSAGKFLWARDHGWNIEMGAWYSPYFVADMDGDGKAEVVSKVAPLSPDYRDPDGRVQRGPEFLAVLNGLTGETIAQTSWPERAAPDPIDDYNHYASRNQIALAYLDGKTPCAIVERGTYGKMIVDAYCLKNGQLVRLWRFNNEFLPKRYRGQGDHACLCCDVDGDGCDEVVIGSLCLDQDGTVLWCTGRGHSDAHYCGDIDPLRPGKELFYVYETAQRFGGGLFVCDPATGEEIWKLPIATHHVHGSGMCADICPKYPGLEIYGQEVDQGGGKMTRRHTHPASDNRWFYAANGTLLAEGIYCKYNYSQGRKTVWWDADLQREIVVGAGIADHEGRLVAKGSYGSGLILDLDGDWREECLVYGRGEIRIYSTDIPAFDRRVTLMRDRGYRQRITMETSGYGQCPILGYVPSAVSPNVSLRLDSLGRTLRFDVTAPLDAPLKGTLTLDETPKDWKIKFEPTPIDLKPGERWSRTLNIARPPNPRGRYDFHATLTRPNLPPLVIHQPQWF